MIELYGKYNTAKVYTDNIDNETIAQIIELCNQESMKDSTIRIMSDCHAGAGCVIGTTMTIHDKVIPNLVGVDIGCFAGETEVYLSGRGYVEIKDLAEKEAYKGGFMVDSFDTERGVFVISRAWALKTRENAPLVKVTWEALDGETSVRCTPDHKFLCVVDDDVEREYRWVEAKDLTNGMVLLAENLVVRVASVEELDEFEDVYCLQVEDTHNFSLKNGVIVHNCGMHVVKIKERNIEFQKLDKAIREHIPSGPDIRKVGVAGKGGKGGWDIERLRCLGKAKVSEVVAYNSIGTLGGGNHFIEVDKDKDGNLYLVVHTGSRRLGKDIAEYYQKEAYELLCGRDDIERERKELIDNLKREGRNKEIASSLKKFDEAYGKGKRASKGGVPYELAYCSGSLLDDYLNDMQVAQEYACLNRQTIVDIICKEMKWHKLEEFETVHNYIDIENKMLRKGSVSACAGERLLIPINMRDGSLLCIGKGNPDWNYSAPHGAGRLMSRSQAKESITLTEFKAAMKGIYSTSVSRGTIDESPMAYKSLDEIMENIKDTVDIVDIIKPVYNFKAGGEG